MVSTHRNGYIDVVKFLFAVMIAEFHLGSGIFPGGRSAVEGFFMLSSYLMMKYIEKNPFPQDSIGRSTARFICHKYKGLFCYLLPSVLIGYSVFCIKDGWTGSEFFNRLPLLFFEILPLRTAGFKGSYVLGISWYLSSMFIALALLYPFCKKFRSNFILIACPILFVSLFGILSDTYGHIAIATEFVKGTYITSGTLRGIAASAAGCIIYEISNHLSKKSFSIPSRLIFTVLEIAGFAYLFYANKFFTKSAYDYLLVFLIFGLLIIGINRLSYIDYIWTGNWTKPLGIISTLIVLNHYCWVKYLQSVFGEDFASSDKVWIFVAAVAASSLATFLVSLIIRSIMKKLSYKKNISI